MSLSVTRDRILVDAFCRKVFFSRGSSSVAMISANVVFRLASHVNHASPCNNESAKSSSFFSPDDPPSLASNPFATSFDSSKNSIGILFPAMISFATSILANLVCREFNFSSKSASQNRVTDRGETLCTTKFGWIRCCESVYRTAWNMASNMLTRSVHSRIEVPPDERYR